ncbi:hypothetical protein [Paraburkholderia kururiensis]|uniref:hypothetical protein n=1 Tax=Paraburkholderia kururiensis TaxID=984307 RepID=UPI0005A9E4E3|nr:hypothetical protein [Paraburkholderia kururiensis]
MTVAQEKALIALDPYLRTLRTLCLDSWQDYQSYPVDKRAVHDSTTRANIVHSHWVQRAAQYAELTPGWELLNLTRLHVLVARVGDIVFALRMKKVDGELRSSNVTTQQIEDFRNQEPLEGIPEACHLELGYMLNASATAVSGIYLICPSGKGVLWSVEIKAESVETVIADLYANREPAAPEDQGAILRPKRTESETTESPLEGTTGHET